MGGRLTGERSEHHHVHSVVAGIGAGGDLHGSRGLFDLEIHQAVAQPGVGGFGLGLGARTRHRVHVPIGEAHHLELELGFETPGLFLFRRPSIQQCARRQLERERKDQCSPNTPQQKTSCSSKDFDVHDVPFPVFAASVSSIRWGGMRNRPQVDESVKARYITHGGLPLLITRFPAMRGTRNTDFRSRCS
jgi:hypothetical protein